jgi:hypothetical protein
MIERFLELKQPLQKSEIDIAQLTIDLTEHDWTVLSNIVRALMPIKVASNALCQRDATLLSSESILPFILNELEKNQSEIGQQLFEAINKCIGERRSHLTVSLLRFLNNGNTLKDGGKNSFQKMPARSSLEREALRLLSKHWPHPTQSEDLESEEANGDDDVMALQEEEVSSLNKTSPEDDLKARLNQSISAETDQGANKKPESRKSKSAILRKEIDVYIDTGRLSEQLKLLKNALLSVKPTSVEPERNFSFTGNLVSKLRSSLGDDLIDDIVFMRCYYKKKE